MQKIPFWCARGVPYFGQGYEPLHNQGQEGVHWGHLENGMKLRQIGRSDGKTSWIKMHAGHDDWADVVDVVWDGEGSQQAIKGCGKLLPDEDCQQYSVSEKADDAKNKLTCSIHPESHIF